MAGSSGVTSAETSAPFQQVVLLGPVVSFSCRPRRSTRRPRTSPPAVVRPGLHETTHRASAAVMDRMSPRTRLSESWPVSATLDSTTGFPTAPKTVTPSRLVRKMGASAPRAGAQAARAGLSPDGDSLSTQRYGIKDRRLARARRAPGPGSRTPGGWSWSLHQRSVIALGSGRPRDRGAAGSRRSQSRCARK